MGNSFGGYAMIFERNLDKAAVRDAVTGWMDANAGQVQYHGGATVKVPKMTTQGLANYSRSSGYVAGDVGLSYETFTMTQDRGRKFVIDAMDVEETNFVATAANVMKDFQSLHVVPEIDAYRISKLATYAIGAAVSGMIEYGYTPGAANTSALRKFKEGVKAVREQGYNGELVCQASDTFIMELELELSDRLRSITWSRGGFDTTVRDVDGVYMIPTPSNRMYTAITLNDGSTSGQTDGGFAKGASAKDINFLIMPVATPIAIQKQDKVRIFGPDINQALNAWQVDYRRYHDLWVLDNKKASIFVNIKDANS